MILALDIATKTGWASGELGSTPQFGAVEIPRDEYRKRLAAALQTRATLAREISPDQLLAFLQSTAQTS